MEGKCMAEAGTASAGEAGRFKEPAKEAEGKCPISNALRGALDTQLEAKFADDQQLPTAGC